MQEGRITYCDQFQLELLLTFRNLAGTNKTKKGSILLDSNIKIVTKDKLVKRYGKNKSKS